MSILSTSPNIIQFDARIATEFKDLHSAILIEYLMNLSLPLPEKTLFTKEEIRKILTQSSSRQINVVISNLEKKKILEKQTIADSWIVNTDNLIEFTREMGGER